MKPNPMTIESVTLPRALRDFVDTAEWTFAKTMPEWPHEYIVRERVSDKVTNGSAGVYMGLNIYKK